MKKKEEIRAKVLEYLKRNENQAFRQKELARRLKINQRDYTAFKRILREMSRSGLIEKQSKHKYGYFTGKGKIVGYLSVRSRGFGIVTDRESDEEVFIGYYDLGTALDGDLVRVELYRRQFGPRREGRVVEILERAKKVILGIMEETFGGFYCIPVKPTGVKKIFISSEDARKASPGDMVTVVITTYPDKYHECQGYVKKVIGDPEDPKNDFEAVRYIFNLPGRFGKKVRDEADEMDPFPEEEIKRRLDLRDKVVITIDPPDAKDFDDAVSLEKLENGNWLLGVHISDVSFYVKENSSLDREARKRGTSIYLINHVIPMLPERLSNQLCSLEEGKDRLTQSVFMEISSGGEILKYEFADTIIHNKKRFNYQEVQEIIEGRESPFQELIQNMNHLAKQLLKLRQQQGSIDFDLPEPEFVLDSNENTISISRKLRLDSHRLIEEFMLAANRCVAEYIGKQRVNEKLPFIYRIHEQPSESDVKSFLKLLKTLGVTYRIKGEIQPYHFRDILEIISIYPFRDFIEKVALRTMTKALYSPRKEGHFGLAFPLYTHFTSPIRRYPDLVVHRLLRKYRKGKVDRDFLKSLRHGLPAMTRHMSAMEQRAEEAEREFILIKQLRYLRQEIGQEFEGIISGVTDFGLFIELEDSSVEGFVHISRLKGDYFNFVQEQYKLVGRHSGKIYRLGDHVKIRVLDVNLPRRRADFELIEK